MKVSRTDTFYYSLTPQIEMNGSGYTVKKAQIKIQTIATPPGIQPKRDCDSLRSLTGAFDSART